MSFIDIWKKSWTLNFIGEFDSNYSANEVVAYLTVVGATIINVILMLNLLISILGDKYDLFMVEKKVYDLKEKIDFSLEIQTTLFWKRNYNQPKYFYLITNAFDDEDENQSDDWQGKIVFLEKRQERKLEELNQKSNEIKEILKGALQDKNSVGSSGNLETKIKGVDDKIIEVEKKIMGIEQRVDARMNGVEQKISGVQQEIKAVEQNIGNRINEVENLVLKILGILNK